MLEPVLEQIKSHILTQNPKTFQKGFSGARQYQDGKVVIYEYSEGVYAGLQDNQANYFYIRYLGNIDIDIAPSDNRSTSCDEIQGTALLRLVAWVVKGNLSKLMEVLINDITTVDFGDMSDSDRQTFSGLKILYNQIITDPEIIYKEETQEENEDRVNLPKGVTLVAIDFGILFNYKIKDESCIDRDVCVGCA